MAKHRRVANLMALAVLGTVVQRPMHPYEIASMLRARDKDRHIPIKWGSLYTIVANLAKHGFIEAVEHARQGGRPERTVYRITTEGRAELVDWIRELVSTPEREPLRFAAGLSLLSALPPDEVIELLRARVDTLDAQLTEARTALAHHLDDVPRLFLIEEEHEIVLREAELTWLRGILAELTGGTFPGLAPWRAYHETGRMPPELAELSERGSTDE